MTTNKTRLELTHRPASPGDVERICAFPQSVQELFHLFPKADYPLTVDQLTRAMRERTANTVVLANGDVAAFANLNKWEPNGICAIGNVCVAPHYRGCGAGTYLINVLVDTAKQDHNAASVEVSCFETNPDALKLYERLGFSPIKEETRFDKSGATTSLITLSLKTPGWVKPDMRQRKSREGS